MTVVYAPSSYVRIHCLTCAMFARLRLLGRFAARQIRKTLPRLGFRPRACFDRQGVARCMFALQGYLAHKKTHPPRTLGLCPGSMEGPRGVGVFLWARYPCTRCTCTGKIQREDFPMPVGHCIMPSGRCTTRPGDAQGTPTHSHV